MQNRKLGVLLWVLSATICFSAAKVVVQSPSNVVVSTNKCYVLKLAVTGEVNDLVLRSHPGAPSADFTAEPMQILFNQSSKGTTQYGNLNLCSKTDRPMKEFPVVMNLEGKDNATYELANGGLLMVSVTEAVQKGPMSISIVNGSSFRTSANFSVVTFTEGNLFYAVWNTIFRDKPYEFALVKQYAQSDTGTLPPTKKILLVPSEFWAGYVMAGNRVASISVDQLTPSTNYTICFYLQNKAGQYSDPKCTILLTNNTQFARGMFIYDRKIDPSELNRLLCFVTNYIGSEIISVMTSYGESCNPSGRRPINYRYEYQHQTIRATNSTVIYVLSPTGDQDMQNVRKFEVLFDRDTKKLTGNGRNALAENGISYVKEAKNLGQVPVSDLLARREPYKLKLSINRAERQSVNYVVEGIKCNSIGMVFFVLVANTSGSSSLKKPSVDQTLNCLNAEDKTDEIRCVRVVFSQANQVKLTLNQSTDLKFEGLKSNLEYRLYYVTANEYPRYILSDPEVFEAKGLNISSPGKKFAWREAPVLLLLLLLALTM